MPLGYSQLLDLVGTLTGPTGPQGETGAQGETGPQGVQGGTGPQGSDGISVSYYRYNARTNTQSPPPSNSQIIWNDATQINSTIIYVDHITTDNIDIDVFLALIKTGDNIIIQDANDSTAYQKWTVSGTVSQTLVYTTIPVTYVEGGHQYTNGENIIFIPLSIGISGPQGVQGFQGPTGPNQPITLSGAVTGTGLTAITTTLSNSVVGIANLSATGSPSSATYLRGDNTWFTPAGSGDMILGATQTVTAAKLFSNNTLRLARPDNNATNFYTIVGSNITAARTLTVPLITTSDTLAVLGISQTFSAAQGFSSSPASAPSVSISPTTGGVANPQLFIGGSGSQWIGFPALASNAGLGGPTAAANGRAIGSKLVFVPSPNFFINSDTAIGVETVASRTALWTQAHGVIKYYPDSTLNSVGQFESGSNVVGLNLNGNSTSTIPNLLVSTGSNNYQWISFGANTQVGTPSTTRSLGTKIALYASPNLFTGLDAALGLDSGNALWLSSPSNVRFYPNSSQVSSGQFTYNLLTNDGVRGLQLNSPSDANNLVSQLLIAGAGSQSYTLSFGSTPQLSQPTPFTGTRTAGKKIVLQETTNTFISVESAIGRETGFMWFCDPGGIKFYTNNESTTARAQINSSGLTLNTTLNLRTNTAAAGTAPIYFNTTSPVLLTTPVNGAMEYDNTDLFITANSTRQTILKGRSGNFSTTATASTAFVVTFGGTQPNSTYEVAITPTNLLSCALLYISAKTTTTFTVTYLSGLTGTVAFDWILTQ
jgi:hypothetical protein